MLQLFCLDKALTSCGSGPNTELNVSGIVTGGNSGFGLAENTDDLLVGKTLLHWDVLMWLMKTLLINGEQVIR